jgi:hypothetical protein
VPWVLLVLSFLLPARNQPGTNLVKVYSKAGSGPRRQPFASAPRVPIGRATA